MNACHWSDVQAAAPRSDSSADDRPVSRTIVESSRTGVEDDAAEEVSSALSAEGGRDGAHAVKVKKRVISGTTKGPITPERRNTRIVLARVSSRGTGDGPFVRDR